MMVRRFGSFSRIEHVRCRFDLVGVPFSVFFGPTISLSLVMFEEFVGKDKNNNMHVPAGHGNTLALDAAKFLEEKTLGKDRGKSKDPLQNIPKPRFQ